MIKLKLLLIEEKDPILKKKGDKSENQRKTIEIWQERSRGIGFQNKKLNQNEYS